jgi:glycine/D-amino acid oxidase-like deaminating enzyme
MGLSLSHPYSRMSKGAFYAPFIFSRITLVKQTIDDQIEFSYSAFMEIETKPSWKVGLQKPDFQKLTKNIKADVVIVGAGLAGVLTAYQLARSGKKVVVLEKKKIGSGATEYTTAFITQSVDTDLSELIKLFGEENAKLVWESGADAINLIEQIVRYEKIDCEYSRTSVFEYANSDKEFAQLKTEREIAARFGFDVSEANQDLSLNFQNYGYYELRNQAKFHPLKFLVGLAVVCRELGVEIFEESEVTQINHHESSYVSVETKTNTVEARSVVVATYQPFHNRTRLFLKRGMYKSYVFEVRLPKGLIQEGLYWDTSNPYHYFRIDEEKEDSRMIIGGEDIKTIVKMDKEKNFKALEDYLRSILPGISYTITRKWTGPILEPSDGLALIGKMREREYVASAFSGNGMTYSAIAAMILSDLVTGYRNVYAKLYDPQRIPSIRQLFIKGSDYMEEFLGGAAKNILKKGSTTGGLQAP